MDVTQYGGGFNKRLNSCPPPGCQPPARLPPRASNLHQVPAQVHSHDDWQPHSVALPRSNVVPPPPPPQPATPHRQTPPLSSPTRDIIFLDSMPERPRARNDYVDSPTSVTPVSALRPPPLAHHHHHHHHTAPYNGTCLPADTTRLPITQQPGAKKKDNNNLDTPVPTDTECKTSIYCAKCHKCKCGQCTGKKELPRAWLCNNKCECSLQKFVDVCSCLCLVKGVFYHCCSHADGDCTVSPSDDPCACCDAPGCCKRWTCMGLMSLALPCLFLYWPLKCGLSMCTACYNGCCRRQGCRCRRDRLPASKGLLLDSESSSA